ncbi:hypothetical protein ACHAXR_005628, partial [Thalassiosira sp. AJA248-18]
MPPITTRRAVATSLAAGAIALLSSSSSSNSPSIFATAKLADRSRVNSVRKAKKNASSRQQRRTVSRQPNRPVEGAKIDRHLLDSSLSEKSDVGNGSSSTSGSRNYHAGSLRGAAKEEVTQQQQQQQQQSQSDIDQQEQPFRRQLSSQLTGCCTNYISYSAMDMCSLYGEDCESGEQPSHDSGDEDCSQAGLSFIGVSFSVNTALGNPYSYQLCDQYPMENIIDRSYEYVMSMDEDGWLVGGGYKSFDYSGKMPYIDSSHTELLRIGSVDPDKGGTSIEQVYDAMDSLSFPPFAIFPEYVKGGGGHGSSDDGENKSVPSSDITLIVSVVDTYEDGESYSSYETFTDSLFDAMDAVGGGPCMDDHDTDPHVSMSRGVKFKSSYHQQKYFYKANLEVAVWQAMYPKGVVIGSNGYASFPPDSGSKNKMYTGYGNLYFFFDRANITKAFVPSRDLTSTENYYATLITSGNSGPYYEATTTIGFDYNKQSGSGSGDYEQEYYEHNPYGWNAQMSKHDMTDGWELPPDCNQEGETFFGIPLSETSDSKMLSTDSFQNQFDFEYLADRNFTYMQKFGTNHGWLVGETLGNGAGSIVDKDTAHIPLFYTGTTNPDMGGMALENLIKIGKKIDFGTLYIKPAFVFQDDDGSVKLQFEADANSALGYLYSSLCQMIGITWNYDSPYNDLGLYTNCAMHAAGDRAKYGCGPENGNSGGFCPQMTLAYRVQFQSEDHAASYLAHCNDYVDYWRSLYPSGVAVGTNKFCKDGGCLALFLNRFDVFYVFKPDLGGSWVEFMGGTMAPTISPAPTYDGGCDNPHNMHLDKCFRKKHVRRSSSVAWDSLGAVGQLSVFLIAFMASTLTISIFLARAKRRRQDGESYLGFLVRDIRGQKKKKRKKLRKKVGRGTLDEDLLSDDDEGGFRSVPARPGKKPPTSVRSNRSRSISAKPPRSMSKPRSRVPDSPVVDA